LISQGWVEEVVITKEVRAKGGTLIPSPSRFYRITAVGIDKIEGPGEFTMDRFHGIKIEATGQNIITVGDGNQVDAKYGSIGEALAELRAAITESEAPETDKVAYVVDIDTIQAQLAKPSPNKTIIAAAWETVKGAGAISSCAPLVLKVQDLLAGFLT
jgi:hypothetical protein